MNKIESVKNQAGDCPNEIAQAPPAQDNPSPENVEGGCLPRPCSACEGDSPYDWVSNLKEILSGKDNHNPHSGNSLVSILYPPDKSLSEDDDWEVVREGARYARKHSSKEQR